MATMPASLSPRTRLGVVRGLPTRKLHVTGASRPTRDLVESAAVVELSRPGLLISTNARLDIGEPVEVLLPEAEGVVAHVVWVGDDFAALAFQFALTNATLARIRLRTGRFRTVSSAMPDRRQMLHPTTTLGQRIRNLRVQCGYTMVHFASRVGVSKPTLWKWEKDMVLPQQKTLKRIAAELGTTEQTLLYGAHG